ncbi:hypothetical protein ES703_124128 [subsurface metagenome]
MIRKSTINLKYANKGKLERLSSVVTEYRGVVNRIIDHLWENEIFIGSFVKGISFLDTWLGAGMKQCAAKQALGIVKSQRRKRRKTKPVFGKLIMELDQRFVTVKQDINSFDLWVHLSSLGNKIMLNLPSKKHTQFNRFKDWSLKRSIRIRKTDRGFFADLYFEKLEP